jgi:hypothetical protein
MFHFHNGARSTYGKVIPDFQEVYVQHRPRWYLRQPIREFSHCESLTGPTGSVPSQNRMDNLPESLQLAKLGS